MHVLHEKYMNLIMLYPSRDCNYKIYILHHRHLAILLPFTEDYLRAKNPYNNWVSYDPSNSNDSDVDSHHKMPMVRYQVKLFPMRMNIIAVRVVHTSTYIVCASAQSDFRV